MSCSPNRIADPVRPRIDPAALAKHNSPPPAVAEYRLLQASAAGGDLAGSESGEPMDAFGDEPVEPRAEDQLVLLAQGGDMDAMTELLDRHLDYVHHLCRRMLRAQEDVEDARQEALLQAARKIATFNGRASFRTWLHVVTKNVCLQAIRQRRDVDDVTDNEPASDADNDEWLIVVGIDIDAALEELPTALRDVVIMYYFTDLDQDGIADILGINRVTVATRLHKAKQKLKPLLTQADNCSEDLPRVPATREAPAAIAQEVTS
jgi:RNA polymerase sigma-70 factor, ECF subfamily